MLAIVVNLLHQIKLGAVVGPLTRFSEGRVKYYLQEVADQYWADYRHPVNAELKLWVKASLGFEFEHITAIIMRMNTEYPVLSFESLLLSIWKSLFNPTDWSLINFKVRINKVFLLDRIRSALFKADVNAKSTVRIYFLEIDFRVPWSVSVASYVVIFMNIFIDDRMHVFIRIRIYEELRISSSIVLKLSIIFLNTVQTWEVVICAVVETFISLVTYIVDHLVSWVPVYKHNYTHQADWVEKKPQEPFCKRHSHMGWKVHLLVPQLSEVVVVLEVRLKVGHSTVRVLAATHVCPLKSHLG